MLINWMKAISLFFFFFFITKIFGQNWAQVLSVPSPERDDGVAFSVGDYGYVVTGNQDGFAESNKLYKYYPLVNEWQEETTFPGEPRQYAGSFVIEDFAYVFCGLSTSNQVLNDVWRYNSITLEWKRMNDFPGEGRWSFFTFSTNDFGFLGTGSTIAYGNVSDCWKYDPKKDFWSTIQQYPEGAIREVGGFCLGEDCYAGTGMKFNPLSFSKKFYHYNVMQNLWSSIDDFPGHARGYVGMENVGNKAIVGGGWGNQNEFYRDVYEFSLEHSWKKIEDFPFQGWRGMSSFSIGHSAYFLTGFYEDFTRTSDVLRYNITTEPKAVIYPNPTSDKANLYNSFEGNIEIFNLEGHKIVELMPNAEGFHSLPNLSAGIYWVKVFNLKQLKLIKWIIL
jgi:N-acetylneuraminic acid mutarotase